MHACKLDDDVHSGRAKMLFRARDAQRGCDATPGLLLSNQPAREFDMEYIMAHLRSGKRQKILYTYIVMIDVDGRDGCANDG